MRRCHLVHGKLYVALFVSVWNCPAWRRACHVVFSPKCLYKVFVLFVLDHNFSANILLDDHFQPKISDFAMAHFRLHLEHQSSTISMTSSSSKHLWYLPEEYIRQGKLSTKTDVYSFGIVSTKLTKEKNLPHTNNFIKALTFGSIDFPLLTVLSINFVWSVRNKIQSH